MPYKKTKLKSGKYRLSGPSGVHAKASTKEDVEKQERLLRAVEHGWRPTGVYGKKKKSRKKGR
jgi:hypothetical protein